MLSIQNFDYKITYKKSSDIIITDALSQAPVEDDKFQFHFSDVNLSEFLAVREQTRNRLVSATKEDKNLQKLTKFIKQSFPMRYKALELVQIQRLPVNKGWSGILQRQSLYLLPWEMTWRKRHTQAIEQLTATWDAPLTQPSGLEWGANSRNVIWSAKSLADILWKIARRH